LEKELIRKAISEINNPTFVTTEQFMEVHNVELENGIPKI
jgi:DNA-binding phage protein